jgi:hypothetical protein
VVALLLLNEGPVVRLNRWLGGWVFVIVKVNSNPEPVLTEISVETGSGSWTFKILNHSAGGLVLRRKPIDT